MTHKRAHKSGLRPGATLDLCPRDLDSAGCGIAWLDGCDVRVFDLLPGERATVSVEHVSPHQPRAWARVVTRLGPSAPQRAVPPCPGFGRCGGCVWQHLDYPAQLEHKRKQVADALSQFELTAAVSAPIAADRITGYRNKASYVVGAGPDGVILGAYQQRSHQVVATAGCQVVEPVIDRIASRTRTMLAQSGLAPYDERQRTGALRYVVLRTGADGRVLVGLVTTSTCARPPLCQVASDIAIDPAVTGVVWVRNDRRDGALFDRSHAPETLVGQAWVGEAIADEASSVLIELGIGDFFQVNRAQAARLRALVATEAAGLCQPPTAPATIAATATTTTTTTTTTAGTAGSAADRANDSTDEHLAAVAEAPDRPKRAIDLYAGVGSIGFALAACGFSVWAIESLPSAVNAAQRAAVQAGLGARMQCLAGDASDLVAIAQTLPGPVDVVTVNPPRKGLSAPARQALIALAPPALIYVSCGPTSLARDLAELVPAGWRIERVQPIDLMPGTPQIETVVSLRKQAP